MKEYDNRLPFLRHIYKSIKLSMFKLLNNKSEKFICPVCTYTGPFRSYSSGTIFIKDHNCPSCWASYHRLQYLVIKLLSEHTNFSTQTMLHVAPERFFRIHMQKIFKQYITTALDGPNCQLYSDLLDLPFKDKSFDFILASHVLEHIKEDYKALSEISRILKPGAIAILPVPIVAVETLEYKESHQDQFGHVRAPGLDYFEMYKRYFSKVIIYKSSDFQNIYQTYINENRKKTFTNIQLLPSLDENKYMDYVPVCFA